MELVKSNIANKIYTLRGRQVMLDSDLAELYHTETKIINRAVRRNANRFPVEFMFQLTMQEWQNLRFQTGTSTEGHGGRRYIPTVFTEQGIAMLSAILKSDIAVEVSIRIMNAFVEMRRTLFHYEGLQHRMGRLEQKQADHDHQFEKIFKALDTGTIPQQGIFFDGQTFDAYTFVADLIRSARQSIRLVDNYIDDKVLLMLSKRQPGVTATLYCRNRSKELQLDLDKHNSQYPPVDLHHFNRSHDRFLILDDEKIYQIGASLKDLGKRWFAFTLLDKSAVTMVERLKEL